MLWKNRTASGRHYHPYFRQYIDNNIFNSFKLVAHFCWESEEHWFNDTRDLNWDIFLPCPKKLKDQHNNLMCTLLLVLNESILGWRPKTMKTGRLPKLTWEPRKLFTLGTVFRDGVEASTGILVYQSIIQHAEVMKQL
jgi:hypothetical protein